MDLHIEHLEKNLINRNPFHVGGKKLGELWSTKKVLEVQLTHHLSEHFAGDYISALRGYCPLKFLHALEIDQGLLAHTPTGTPPPPPRKKMQKFKILAKNSACELL